MAADPATAPLAPADAGRTVPARRARRRRGREGDGGTGLLVGMSVLSGSALAIFPLYPALQEAHGLSTASIGVVAAAGFLAAVVAELLIAPLADRGHGRRMLVGGALLMAASMVVAATATDAALLALSRALGGLAFGAYLPAAAAVFIRRDPEGAGHQIGRLYTADLLGLSVGPLVASALLLVWSPSAILLACGLVALAAVPVVAPAARRAAEADRPAPDAAPPRLALDLLRHRTVWSALLLTLGFMIPVGAYDAIWPRFLVDIGGSDVLVGLSYTLFAIPFVLVATRAGRLADRIGGLPTAALGLAVMAVAVTLYSVLDAEWVVVGIAFVESTGQAAASVAAAAAMAYATPLERAGAAQGLARAAGTLAAGLVALVAAPVYQELGRTVLFAGTAVTIVLVVAGAALLAPAGGRRLGGSPAVRRAQREHAEVSPGGELGVGLGPLEGHR